jgi:hypothetical protein
MKSLNKRNLYFMIYVLLFLIIIHGNVFSTQDVSLFLENFEKPEKHTALSGKIDSLTIIRGNAEFHLGAGELTLFDFGWDRPSAMVFAGPVRFIYKPPDEIEHYQLHKFTGKDTLDCEFDTISFFFTVELDNFPDTSLFVRQEPKKRHREILEQAHKDAFDHFGVFMPNRILYDFLNEDTGKYFYADFRIKKFDHLVYRENIFADDYYRLYKLRRSGGYKTYDVYGGYSEDEGCPSKRGIMPIDIKHYNIESKIETSGEMVCKCRIYFAPLKKDIKYLNLMWYCKNKPLSAFDPNGDSLKVINKKEQWGLGFVLNKPLPDSGENYIEILYESPSLINTWGIFHMVGGAYWYPHNEYWDRATFDLTYDCPMQFEIVSCGELMDTTIANERSISHWQIDMPVEYVSFAIGTFEKKDFQIEGLPEIKVYMSRNIPHRDLVNYFVFYYGELTTKDMVSAVGADVMASMLYFTQLYGLCPFVTVKAIEVPGAYGQGSPGLVQYSWLTYQFQDLIGSHEQFRAHEISHQWWGHVLDYESYRDVWIIEGLAEYSAFLYYQELVRNVDAWMKVLDEWRKYIKHGKGGGSQGTKAGPMILGQRLSSSKSSDYTPVVYTKGAYIFHMLRYLMHDYNTDSDDRFIAFLRDLLERFKYEPITTEALRVVLEKHLQTDMTWFFDQWVYGIHIPEYTFAYDTQQDAEGNYLVSCNVKQKNVPDDFKMVVPLMLHFEGGKFAYKKIWVDQPVTEVQLPPLPMKPTRIELNPNYAVLCDVKYK